MITDIATLPAPTYRLERHTLSNGLRVLFAPDRTVPVVGIAVHYDVGMRSEPPGRTGFAHLFEHLMFQGSANLPKPAHSRYVESAGGVFNGSTHMDYTQYYEVLPKSALERGLFLEADRMAAPDLNEVNLRLQIEVVKEEIRVNVKNRPYGCFPWVHLPQVLFEQFANAHDGYGSFEDLDRATVDDAHQFFDTYYAPANALLCVTGDFDPDPAAAMVERHFGGIVRRPAPQRPTFGEPGLMAERRMVHIDRHAPLPAVAAGWRVPDPVGEWTGYLPFVLLTELLSDGDSSRLARRLVRTDRIATQAASYIGMLGNPFDVRDPTGLVLQARHPADVPVDSVLDAADDEFRRLADLGLPAGELSRVLTRKITRLLRDTDSVAGRTHALAAFELQHGRAELLDELPTRLAAVTGDEIRTAAATLSRDRRAVVELRPYAGSDRSGQEGPVA